MITVIYHRGTSCVTIDGHAQSGEKGHDLVCASASILAYTLSAFVNNMKAAGQTESPSVELTEGHAVIACNAPSRYQGAVALVFDSLCAGFDILAQQYPENISFEIVRED